MTLQDIITEVRQIVQETNPSNTHASDSVITGWVNACTLQLCSTLSTLPKVSVPAIVGADTITLPTNLLKMDYVSIVDANGIHQKLNTIDFVNFSRITSGWEDQEADKPSTLVRMDDLTWMLFPKPNTEFTGKAMTIIGTVLPTPLVHPTDVAVAPKISIAMHPCYPHYCAWKFFLLLNNPERAAASYAAYDGLRRLNTQTTTSTTGSLLSFKIRGI